jgi:hypothetical protein
MQHTFLDDNSFDVTGDWCSDGGLHLANTSELREHEKKSRKLTFMALKTVDVNNKLESTPDPASRRNLPQTGSPFLISWPSLTRTSTTTPDMGAPTEPGSEVAFSRETVSTAEFLSSIETART